MMRRKNIFAIIGSAGSNSANLKLVELIAAIAATTMNITVFNGLKTLPHFDPDLSAGDPPEPVIAFRRAIEEADGIMICTPEYIFSIPSGLKNALEWCIATTVFSDKPCGLITAAASGARGHEELQLIMKTAMAKFNPGTTLLVPGIKGKFDTQGHLVDEQIPALLHRFVRAFERII